MHKWKLFPINNLFYLYCSVIHQISTLSASWPHNSNIKYFPREIWKFCTRGSIFPSLDFLSRSSRHFVFAVSPRSLPCRTPVRISFNLKQKVKNKSRKSRGPTWTYLSLTFSGFEKFFLVNFYGSPVSENGSEPISRLEKDRQETSGNLREAAFEKKEGNCSPEFRQKKISLRQTAGFSCIIVAFIVSVRGEIDFVLPVFLFLEVTVWSRFLNSNFFNFATLNFSFFSSHRIAPGLIFTSNQKRNINFPLIARNYIPCHFSEVFLVILEKNFMNFLTAECLSIKNLSEL